MHCCKGQSTEDVEDADKVVFRLFVDAEESCYSMGW